MIPLELGKLSVKECRVVATDLAGSYMSVNVRVSIKVNGMAVVRGPV